MVEKRASTLAKVEASQRDIVFLSEHTSVHGNPSQNGTIRFISSKIVANNFCTSQSGVIKNFAQSGSSHSSNFTSIKKHFFDVSFYENTMNDIAKKWILIVYNTSYGIELKLELTSATLQ